MKINRSSQFIILALLCALSVQSASVKLLPPAICRTSIDRNLELAKTEFEMKQNYDEKKNVVNYLGCAVVHGLCSNRREYR
jgi:hypothetical protein